MRFYNRLSRLLHRFFAICAIWIPFEIYVEFLTFRFEIGVKEYFLLNVHFANKFNERCIVVRAGVGNTVFIVI